MSEPDWADKRAVEWINAHVRVGGLRTHRRLDLGQPNGFNRARSALAALLREVVRDTKYEQWCEDQHVTAEELSKQLAEVRRVVEETVVESIQYIAGREEQDAIKRVGYEILRRFGEAVYTGGKHG